MEKNELLKEKENLKRISRFYTNSNWGFYTKLVKYGYKSIKPYFRGKTLLELGPADGEMTKFLCEDFEKIYVVDASEAYIKKVERIDSKIKGFNALFEEFDTDLKFDTIIMAHVLEHVVSPIQILEKSKKWLNKNGRIIIIVPNANSFHRHIGVKMGLLKNPSDLNSLDQSLGHRRVYDSSLIDHQIGRAGLKIVAGGGIFLKFISNSQLQSLKEPKLFDALYELGKEYPDKAGELFRVVTV